MDTNIDRKTKPQQQILWKRQILFKKYILQIMKAQSKCPPLAHEKLSNTYENILTGLLTINSFIGMGVALNKSGGIFNRTFVSALALVCYLNISWHFYGLEVMHVRRIALMEGPVGYWYREKYRNNFGEVKASKKVKQYEEIFILPYIKNKPQ